MNDQIMKCKDCKFSQAFRANPLEIKSTLICRFNPPQFQLAPTPQGMAPGFGFPMVQDDLWCHQWTASSTGAAPDTSKELQ